MCIEAQSCRGREKQIFRGLLKIRFVQILSSYRTLFKWAFNEIRDCDGFASFCSVIGLKSWRHPLDQSDTKLKLISSCSLVFFGA